MRSRGEEIRLGHEEESTIPPADKGGTGLLIKRINHKERKRSHRYRRNGIESEPRLIAGSKGEMIFVIYRRCNVAIMELQVILPCSNL